MPLQPHRGLRTRTNAYNPPVINQKQTKNMGLYDKWTNFEVKKKLDFIWQFGLLRGHNPIYKKNSLTLQLSSYRYKWALWTFQNKIIRIVFGLDYFALKSQYFRYFILIPNIVSGIKLRNEAPCWFYENLDWTINPNFSQVI